MASEASRMTLPIVDRLRAEWMLIGTCPPKIDETAIFEVLWKCGWGDMIPITVQWFQGDLYPHFRHGNIDYEDRIEGATHWRWISMPLSSATAN